MRGSTRVMVDLAPAPYAVHVGSGLLGTFPALMSRAFKTRRAFIATDSYLAPRAAAALRRGLAAGGWSTAMHALPRGERAKSFTELMKLYGAMLAAGVERGTPLIAVGGGTVGDAAGFAAATYYRGIPLVHVPTTLLAQVDSSIGGKTAVNHPRAKNAVGAFYQPRLVVADAALLRTLPRRDFLSGLGEVVKYALVFDRSFAASLRARWAQIERREPAELVRIVRTCASLKARVVAEDVLDLSGKRELLNFGHTIGHALESATGYRRFLHGEAVAWGMRAALSISQGRGGMRSPKERALAAELLDRLETPAWPRSVTAATIIPLLKHDKKVRSGKSVFVLLKGIGRPLRTGGVSRAEISAALEGLSR